MALARSSCCVLLTRTPALNTHEKKKKKNTNQKNQFDGRLLDAVSLKLLTVSCWFFYGEALLAKQVSVWRRVTFEQQS